MKGGTLTVLFLHLKETLSSVLGSKYDPPSFVSFTSYSSLLQVLFDSFLYIVCQNLL